LRKQATVESTAEAYLELLAARGIEYLFANAGTDFAPIIEAYARRGALGLARPRPMTIPHEMVAVSMAHGYTMVTGRPQAVMVHVIVGTANALGGIINAARSNVPMLMTAGRNPITEAGAVGSRNLQIHWAQESFDQGAMVREFVKWDYELRTLSPLETVVDRALAIAQSEPRGPVYLTLPREVLAERLDTFEYSDPARAPRPGPLAPDAATVAEAARLLASARNPIIITKALGRDPEAVPSLVAVAVALAVPVFEQASTHMNFPQNHPLHAGFAPATALGDADLIVVAECDAPWYPAFETPRPDAKVIQIGADPLYSRYPIRGFHGDVALAGSPRLALRALAEAATPLADRGVISERRRRWEGENTLQREMRAARARAVATDTPMDMAWVSRCVGDLVDDHTILVNEYDFDQNQGTFTRPGSYFQAPPAGGLGWGLGAALGAKLAAPEDTVICCVGDGAYIFGAPTAAHFVSRAYGLPVLFVVFNNRMWNAVKRAVQTHAKDGWAARMDSMPLTELDPAPDYELVCRASGGYAECVENPAELPGALERALRAVRVEKRQALLNVICKKP